MDIQFIVEAYACVKYCVSYISKSCRGMSKLLKAAMEDVKYWNSLVREKLRKVANLFLNSTEASAQEAAYSVLGLHLSESSRICVFISTGVPENVFLSKSADDLMKLPPDSYDVIHPGLLDHYAQRPAELENICLAEFAAGYNYSSKRNVGVMKERKPSCADLPMCIFHAMAWP